MRVLASMFGVGALLAGALGCLAQERAAIEPGLLGFESAVPESPRTALTTAGPKPALYWNGDRRRTTKMTPPVVQIGTHQRSTVADPFETLRKQFRLEKTANYFHREVKLHLVGLGPVQIAAFEARRPAEKLHVAMLCVRDCAGEGALRQVYRAQSPRRSYGLTLALRWN